MSGIILSNSDTQISLYGSNETSGEVDKRIFKAIDIIKNSAGDSVKLKQELSSLKIDIVARLSETNELEKFNVINNIIQRLKETNSPNHLSEVYQQLISCFLENNSFSSSTTTKEGDIYTFFNSIGSLGSLLKLDEDFRVAFLLQKAKTDPEWTCLNTKYYGIRSQAALTEIAKAIARQSVYIFSMNFAQLGITSQDSLIEIAKSIASGKGASKLWFIEDLGITSQDALTDIAKILVHNDSLFPTYIKKFHITSQDVLTDMVKVVVDNRYNISGFIQNFGVLSEDLLIDIAKTAVQYEPGTVCSCINRYGIKSQDALIAIAKSLAEIENSDIGEHIHKFGITSQEALIDVAKIQARQKGSQLSKNIKNYGITSPEALIAIAKIRAEQNSDILSYLDDFGISSQEDLIDIVYSALLRNRDGTELWFLHQYHLNLESMIALFTRLVHTNPRYGFCINYFFPDKDAVQKYPELRAIGTVKGDFAIYPFLSDLWEVEKVPSALIFPLLFRCETLKKETDPEVKSLKERLLFLYCGALDLAKGSEALSKELVLTIKTIEKESNPQVQKYKINTFAALLMNCRAAGIKEDALLKQMPLWKAFLELRDPMLRSSLQKYVIQEMRQPQVTKDGPKNEWTFVSLLLGSFFDRIDPYVELSFKKNKKEEISVSSKVCSFSERLEDLLNATKDKEAVKSLLRNLVALVETPRLDDAQKAFILHDLLFVKDSGLVRKDQFKQLLRSSELVMLLLDYNHEKDLLSCTQPRELSKVFSTLFFDTLYIEDRSLEESIFNTFAKWRNPNALLVYARTLDTLPEQEKERVFPHLKRYVLNVLNGTFFTNRYALDDNASEHLLKMNSEAPELLEQWKKGERFKLDDYQVTDTDDPCDLLLCGSEVGSCQKVDGDSRFSKGLLSYLLDPKIRMMVIKNDRGAIVARCMLRLLWDNQAKKFVLYQESNYPSPCPLSGMLDEACKKRAAQLNVALVSHNPTEHEVTLQSFKGKVPFEYVDALRGIQENTGYQCEGFVQS